MDLYVNKGCTPIIHDVNVMHRRLEGIVKDEMIMVLRGLLEHPNLTTKELAQRLGLSPRRVSRLLHKAAQLGYVEKATLQ